METDITQTSGTKKTGKTKKIAIIVAAVSCICAALAVLLTQVMLPKQKYDKAVALLDAEEYDIAYAILEELGKTEEIAASKYDRAMKYIDAQDYETALTLLRDLEYKDSEDKCESIMMQNSRALFAGANVGDVISFGSYEQDNDTSNGKEDIEWIVLAKEDNKLLVISWNALDCRPYNMEYEDTTWENCTLRKWLNEDFFNAAFSDWEKGVIPTITVSADKNPDYTTNPGSDTQDKVFLLSITEANEYFQNDEDRICVPSAYAIANGAFTGGSYTKDNTATCVWWLRSPGNVQKRAARVDSIGDVYSYGKNVRLVDVCVRPAMWIDLNA